MKKLLVPVAVLAVAMAVTTLAHRRSQNESLEAVGGGPKKHADQLYVEISALGSFPYFYDHKLGLKIAGEAFGVRTEYLGPAEYDMPAMITAFEQAMTKPGLKGIMIIGFEETLVPIVNKAVEKGIPVVTLDADLPTSKRIAFVGTGNYQAGFKGGQKLAELIGCKGKVALLTKVGQGNLEERLTGYKDALAKHPDIKVVQVADTQSDRVIGAQAAAAVLNNHPDLNGFGCTEGGGSTGAPVAVREAGRSGQVKIVAMDRDNDTLDLIGKGEVSATIAQQTILMPYYGVQILYMLNNQSMPFSSDNHAARVPGVPTNIDTGVIVIDISNYRHFLRN